MSLVRLRWDVFTSTSYIGTLPGGYGYVSPPVRVSSPGISCVCVQSQRVYGSLFSWYAVLAPFELSYLNTNNQQSMVSLSRTGKYNNNAQFSVMLTLPLLGISIGASVLRYTQLPSSALASSHPHKHSVLNATWNNYLANVRTLLLVGNMLFIVGDTFSACAMAYHLTKFKSWAHALPRSQPRRIDVLLNRLLIFAVATGALTSCVPFHCFTFGRRVLGRIALMHSTGS